MNGTSEGTIWSLLGGGLRIAEEAKMTPTDDNSVVDGFTDSAGSTTGEPDPGRSAAAPKPLSPEEYAKLQKEAREPDEKE